jgi:hypothetical protein
MANAGVLKVLVLVSALRERAFWSRFLRERWPKAARRGKRWSGEDHTSMAHAGVLKVLVLEYRVLTVKPPPK